jgi:quercetin dioxygenase-like cupin family protein
MKRLLPILLTSGVGLVMAQDVVPVEKEPRHRVVLENPYVKVLDIAFPPGYTTLFHTHSVDNVTIIIAGGSVRTDRIGTEGTPQTIATGLVGLSPGNPPYTHRIVNLASDTFRALDVEIRGPMGPVASVPDVPVGHTVALDKDRALVRRIRLNAGETMAAHSHPRGWLEVSMTGEYAGRFQWHDAADHVPEVNASAPVEILELEPR